jgi:TusA-related sulfurtransferase
MIQKLAVATIALLLIGPQSASAGMAPHTTWDLGHAANSRSDITLVAERDKGEAGALVRGDRTIVGVVRNVTGEQIEVNTVEGQPRFLALKDAKEKGFPSIKPGDELEIVLNEQNLVVDFHPVHQQQSHQRLKGQIAQPLVVGHERAVIQTEEGKQETYAIRPLARSKVASLPVGTPAVFLIDEMNQIADVAVENDHAVSSAESARKSPPKGPHARVEGTIVEPLHSNTIRIKNARGEERPYEVRPMVGEKLNGLERGQSVILLIDNDGAVIDVAIPPKPKG